MIPTHTPTRFQTARYSVIHALSKGADAEEVVQYIRNYEMEDSFKIGLVAEVLFFIKETNNGMKLEWAPDLGTNIDFCALHIHSRSKIDVTTNLAYKKTMLMSGYIALSQEIYFAEVRFAKDAFIGLSRAKVLLTESVDKMLASVEILWLGSHELYSLNVYNQLVWEVSPDIAQRLIRKKMGLPKPSIIPISEMALLPSSNSGGLAGVLKCGLQPHQGKRKATMFYRN